MAPWQSPFLIANTFSQIYLQFVFSVKKKESLIAKEHKEELHKYITGLAPEELPIYRIVSKLKLAP